jgi:hypothetical protein
MPGKHPFVSFENWNRRRDFFTEKGRRWFEATSQKTDPDSDSDPDDNALHKTCA